MKAEKQTWPLAIVVLAMLLNWPAPLHAQQKTQFTFAVIQYQRILREAKATKSIRPQREKLRTDFENAVRDEERKLRAAERELVNQRSILSPEAYLQRRQKLERQAKEAQRNASAKKREIERALATAMNKVRRNLRKITAAIAKERSVNLVLPGSMVVLFERKFDITKEVLKRLDEQLPSLKVIMPSTTKPPETSEKN